MRIVVFGATGNVGTSLLDALERDEHVDSRARRRAPAAREPRSDGKVKWAAGRHHDATTLAPVASRRGRRRPPRVGDPALATTSPSCGGSNVDGSARVFRAVADAGVPALVHASSVGAYSPGPKDRLVDESWPTGRDSRRASTARHKAEVERLLDRFEQEHAFVRTVRLRPGADLQARGGGGAADASSPVRSLPSSLRAGAG